MDPEATATAEEDEGLVADASAVTGSMVITIRPISATVSDWA